MSETRSRKGLRSGKETTGVSKDPRSDRDETEKPMSEVDLDHTRLMLEGLAKLSSEIQDFKTTIRCELSSLKTDLKEDLTSLHQDMERKFRENSNVLEDQKASPAEAQARIVELEEWNTEANASLQSMLTHTRTMQDKITELEARSRRNNMRIFGLLEERENDSVTMKMTMRFQTPYTKMRIFWNEGPQSYNNAMVAALDLRARGYEVNLPEESGGGNNRINAATGCERVSRGRDNTGQVTGIPETPE